MSEEEGDGEWGGGRWNRVGQPRPIFNVNILS